MARIDDLAAKEEIAKAEQCDQQADQLAAVAHELRLAARRHLKEAEELRGIGKRRSTR